MDGIRSARRTVLAITAAVVMVAVVSTVTPSFGAPGDARGVAFGRARVTLPFATTTTSTTTTTPPSSTTTSTTTTSTTTTSTTTTTIAPPQCQPAITVGSAPNGVAITPDGLAAYVANNSDGTVSVICLS